MIRPETAWRDRGWEAFGRTAGAVLGLALALVVGRAVTWQAAPDQVPGVAKVSGIDPRVDVLRWALFLTLPVVFAWLGAHLGRRFPAGTLPANINSLRLPAPVFGILIALPVVLTRDLARALLVAAAGTVLCWVAVNGRRSLPRRGSIALPVVTAYAVLLWTLLLRSAISRGVGAWTLALTMVGIAIGLAWVLGSGDLERGAPFLGAAVFLLPVAGWAGRSESISVAAAAAGLLLPFLAVLAGRWVPAFSRWCRPLAVFVLLPGCFTALAATYSFRGPSTMDVFEDGHGLLPASDYLRGEVAYRDFVPAHAFLGDGGLQLAGLALFEDSYRGAVLPARIIGVFYWLVIFLLGLAATGSPAAAFAAVALSFLAFPEFAFLRGLPSIAATAIALYASRTRSEGAWYWSGLAVALSLLWAVEFALYTLPVLAVAIWISRGDRIRILRSTVSGLVTGFLAVCGLFLALGVAGDFLETTFLYVPSLLPAYATGPTRLRGFGLFSFLREKDAFFLAFCGSATVALGAQIPRAPSVGQRARGSLPILAWVLVACLSVVERNHVEYAAALVPLGLVMLARWLKGHRRWNAPRAAAAAVLLVCGLIVWRPRASVPNIAFAVVAPVGVNALASFPELPRARGAVFAADDARIVRSTKRFLESVALTPSDTWFDFSSKPGLYFLFDRDCPVRYSETGFYEALERQQEVIESIERNPRVKAVLMTASTWSESIDGVSNATRAPLVAEYVRSRFEPHYEQDGVQFWLRRTTDSPRSP